MQTHCTYLFMSLSYLSWVILPFWYTMIYHAHYYSTKMVLKSQRRLLWGIKPFNFINKASTLSGIPLLEYLWIIWAFGENILMVLPPFLQHFFYKHGFFNTSINQMSKDDERFWFYASPGLFRYLIPEIGGKCHNALGNLPVSLQTNIFIARLQWDRDMWDDKHNVLWLPWILPHKIIWHCFEAYDINGCRQVSF